MQETDANISAAKTAMLRGPSIPLKEWEYLSKTPSTPLRAHHRKSSKIPWKVEERDTKGDRVTDLDNYDSQAEVENIDVEPVSEQEKVMLILDGDLLRILHNHLDLAARLIPEIHRCVNLDHDPVGGSCIGLHEGMSSGPVPSLAGSTFATSHAETSSGSGQGSSGTASHSSSSSVSPCAMRPQKRGRESNESEGQRDEESKIPKRDPPNISELDGLQRRKRKSTFACHFHKFNPGNMGPGLIIFKDIDELQVHQRSEICPKKSSALKEGIDDSQWAKIEDILRAKRGMSLTEKRKHDIDKWFDIWRIIFPHLSPPSNPWNDIHQSTVTPPQLDFESIVSTFENSIELDKQEGTIQPDDNTHRRYLHALRVALAAAGVISTNISRMNASGSLSSSTQRHQNDFQQNFRESENPDSIMRTPFVENRSHRVIVDEEDYSTIEHVQAGYPSQPTVPFCEGVDWNPSIEPEPSDVIWSFIQLT
ncbi:hypothetical protein B7463_g8322, partial [Scytalidium lignicola]